MTLISLLLVHFNPLLFSLFFFFALSAFLPSPPPRPPNWQPVFIPSKVDRLLSTHFLSSLIYSLGYGLKSASSLINVINLLFFLYYEFLSLWTNLQRNKGKWWLKISNTKGITPEWFKVISHFTCTNMFSTLKNNPSASLVLPISFRNFAINNINRHLSVVVTSKSLPSSTRMERKVNKPEAYLERKKEHPSLNLDSGVKYIIHTLVFLKGLTLCFY